ncbi:TrkA-N [Novosphingobium aromaticivorans DSM 12444]|uniref:TrkA-N n=1 Tax=Novosphingobium aromaticivorans (strain ATCC 700278 / DSM 12444 / CCUG 56034 / CIP 105152 / NBRC 16084 / F199) TaxID=279238 RepID=Q2GBC7_NOVAD|nr:TrkA family potassium uptake protein [Novosphingobium aromaticivorans]ABD24846.1 TrkA-N [Novosphingobium aromaticivorans DSM 12444]SCY15788.1 trk system potassium uptake protein TrkA [Novosphingobium aromaticivorans]
MARNPNRNRAETVLVIGLGRFGTAVASSLIRMGHEVLGVDEDLSRVQETADRLTHVLQADCTSPEALRQIGIADFKTAVIAIGGDIEASILTALAVIEAGVQTIWAKATNERHGKILKSIGVQNVIYPEARMGQMVAHILTGKMMDFVELDNDFAMVKTRTPGELVGLTLEQAQVRQRHGVTIVGVKRPNEIFTYAQATTTLAEGDLLIILGEVERVERFAAQT